MRAEIIQDDMTALPESSSLQPSPVAPPELDLFAFIALIVRNLRFILGLSAICFLGTLVYVLRVKPLFTSTATAVVPQGNSAAASLSARLQINTADMLGGGYELYADMLQSRTIGYRIVDRFHLVDVYGQKNVGMAAEVLKKRTKVETEAEGLLRVTVEDTDPSRASDLANAYMTELSVINSELVTTTAGQQRLFYERELVAEKNRLADAEVALAQVQEHTRGLPPESQAAAALTALTTTRAQLRADQIRLAALLTGATEQNPEVVRLRSQIAGLEGQVASLQSGSGSGASDTPTSKVPEQELEYTRRLRDVKFHETLFNLLETQYEQARQQEAKTPTIIQVLDKAIPATQKAWPSRKLYCLEAIVAGGVIGLLLVSFKALAAGYFAHPRNASKMRQLREMIRSQFRFGRS
jgi:tyrosine-protein kinase Etk/Wzc